MTRHAKRLERSLQEYDKMLGQPADNAYLLQKKLAEIEKVLPAMPDPDLKAALDAWLKDEKDAVDKARDDFRFHFGQRLKELFARDGIAVRGQYPVLRIGMYSLRLNFEFGTAALFFGPEVEKIESKRTLHPQAIYDLIRQYDREIRTGPDDLAGAYDDLARAYDRCLKVAGKAYGDKVLIPDVLKEYVFIRQPKQFGVDARRVNFREFPRIKLSYLLYQLRTTQAGERGMRLHVATFDATADKLSSFWVPDNETGDGTHCAYLSFETRQP